MSIIDFGNKDMGEAISAALQGGGPFFSLMFQIGDIASLQIVQQL
jgi:hypothetical protein